MRRKVYVAGLLFRGPSVVEAASVAMVLKKNPAWQSGIWNAIGGKVETGETSERAMIREGVEEIQLGAAWDFYHEEVGRDYVVSFFRALAPEGYRLPVENDVGEVLAWRGTSLHPTPGAPLVGNLRWLVPMAQDWRRMRGSTSAPLDDISSRPSW